MKKKMSKPLAVILAAAMSLGLLAGCGGSSDSVSGDTQTAAEESSGGGVVTTLRNQQTAVICTPLQWH